MHRKKSRGLATASIRALALLLITVLLLILSVLAASSVMNDDAQSSQRMLTVRMDVQNAGTIPFAPMTFKMNAPTSIGQLHALLQSKIVDSIVHVAVDDHSPTDALAAEYTQMEIDVEAYDARKGQFLPLQSLRQLSQKRVRLNVIIRSNGLPQQSCLALPSKMFDSSEFTIQGVAVSVGEVGNSGQGTGLTTWDGSVVLAKYLEHARMEDIRGTRILEVGSGTGLVGLSAALLGANEVILTDLEYTMDNLSRNVATTMRNAATARSIDCQVHTQVLDWFNPPTNLGSFDFILASDVVWVEELIPPLVLTFDVLLENSKERDTRILMSYQKRSIVSDQLLFAELEKRGFAKQKIPASALHPQFASERIDVWEITRR